MADFESTSVGIVTFFTTSVFSVDSFPGEVVDGVDAVITGQGLNGISAWLGNGPTRATSTILEAQTVVSSGGTSATITVVQGSLPDGSVYLFVENELTQQNATGLLSAISGTSTQTVSAGSEVGGDIKFFPSLTNNVPLGPAEIEVVSGASDVTRDPGLETALMIALFTDCRADFGDPLPFDADGRGGWFGEDVLGEKFGSKLWLLRRSNLTQETLQTAKAYIEDALDRHIIDENIAKTYSVTVTKEDDRMKIRVEIVAENGLTPFYEYYLNWQNQIGG